MAAVGHAEVHGVRPQRWVGEGSSDSGVVEEGLLLHHGELVVATNPQIGGSNTDHRVIGQVGILFDDDSHTSHFLGPVINGGIAPELFVVVVPVNKWEKGYWVDDLDGMQEGGFGWYFACTFWVRFGQVFCCR